MAHCVYIDWTDANLHEHHAHDEHTDSPVFVGATPLDRGGGAEVIGGSRDAAPDDVVDDWLASPFHRTVPMHPGAVRAGACATPGGARVMDLEIVRPTREGPWLYPTDGMTNVPLAFDGHETPDPVPLAEYPKKTLPMGFTLSVWLPLATADSRVTDSWIRAGKKKVAHYVIDRDLSNPDKPFLYLIPKEPLEPSTRYEWGVELESPAQRIEASFTTGPSPFPAGPAPTPFAAWLATENERRAHGDLPPFVPTTALDTIAASYRVRHQWPHELTWPASATIYCERRRAEGPASMQEESSGGAPFTRVGFAADDREVCVVAAADPLQPVPAAEAP
jgi:hypothetical protein